MQAFRIIRVVLGVTQYELCLRSGISRQSLSELENGRAHPKGVTVRAIDRAFMEILDERALKALEERAGRKRLQLANLPPADVRPEIAQRLKGTGTT